MDSAKIWQAVLDISKSISLMLISTLGLQNTFIVTQKQLDDNRQIIEIGCPNIFTRDTVEPNITV
jgi:hypothetical protein